MEAIKLCRLDTPIIFIEARINLSRFVVTGCAAKTSATVSFPSLNLISLFAFCFNIWLNGVASYPSLVSWIKHSVDRFVIVSIFFSSRRRHTRCLSDWSSDVCSSDLSARLAENEARVRGWGRAMSEARLVEPAMPDADRSEERRVGKERRSRWSPYH